MTKIATRDNKGHFIRIKGSIHEEDIIIINIHTPNNRTSKHVKQKLTEIKGEIDNSRVIFEDFNTSLSIMDRTTRWKINKYREDFNNTTP